MIRFGVIGYGYWGPNVVRNLRALEYSEVAVVCDSSPNCPTACSEGVSQHEGLLGSLWKL